MRSFLTTTLKKFPLHLPLFISGSVIILSLGLLALFFVLYPQSSLVAFFRSIDERFGVVAVTQTKSTVEISRLEDRLLFQFKIDEEDKEKVEEFSRRLGISSSWSEGLDIALDSETLGNIEQYLPVKSSMEFGDNKIILSSKSVRFLQSALPKESMSFATGSATVRLFHDESRMSVLMHNPKDLVVYATQSGSLSVSKKVETVVFSIADKIGTIDLSLKNKSLDGEIVLK
jgi:hypothetical protein